MSNLTFPMDRTPAEWRAAAAGSAQRAADSWERSDTDGFLSQWASQSMSSLYLHAADLAEQGGREEFRALFDLDGNLLDAREVEGRFGWVWLVKRPGSDAVAWFNESEAQKDETRIRNNARKGYFVGRVSRRAAAKLVGSMTLHPCSIPLGEVTDEDVIIVDNGH